MSKVKWEKTANVFRIILGCIVLFWVLLTNFCVFTRYIAKVSFAWSDEVFTLLFNWFIFIGAALASIDDKHITITLLKDSLKGRAKHILAVCQNIVFMVFIAIVCYQSWKIVALQARNEMITAVMGIPVWTTTIAMALGCIGWLYVVGYKTVLEVKAVIKKED